MGIGICKYQYFFVVSAFFNRYHTNTIYEALNSQKTILNIFIDYPKAFNTVNISILLRKLEKYGVQGRALDLISSFLRDRKYFVSFGNAKSIIRTANNWGPSGLHFGSAIVLGLCKRNTFCISKVLGHNVC